MVRLVPDFLNLRSLAAFLLALIVLSCGETSGTSAFETSLEGSWATGCVPCYSATLGCQSAKISLTVTHKLFTTTFFAFNDSSCTVSHYTAVTNYGLTLGNPSSVVPGATEINLNAISGSVTPLTSNAASDLNSAQSCGISTYLVNVSQDVSSTDCMADIYDLYKISGNQLFRGDTSSIATNGSTAAKRPVALQSDPYLKQ